MKLELLMSPQEIEYWAAHPQPPEPPEPPKPTDDTGEDLFGPQLGYDIWPQ